MKTPLGKLERIQLRKAWAHEAGEFTSWLAQAESLRKYKYPPDQQDAAVDLVLQQAQALGESWAA